MTPPPLPEDLFNDHFDGHDQRQMSSRVIAVISVLLCDFSFASANIVVRDIGERVSLFTIVTAASLVEVALAVGSVVSNLTDVTMICNGRDERSLKLFLAIVFYGFLEATAAIVSEFSVFYIGAANAMSIVYSEVFFVTIFSAIFLYGHLRWFDCCLSLTSPLSIVLIARPQFLFGGSEPESFTFQQAVFGISAGIFAAMFLALAMLIGKTLMLEYQAKRLTMVLSKTVQQLIIAFTLSMISKQWRLLPTDSMSVIETALAGFCYYCGMSFKLYTLALESPFLVSILQTWEIPIVYMLEHVLLRRSFQWTELVGSAIITVSCVISIITHKNDSDVGVPDDEDKTHEETDVGNKEDSEEEESRMLLLGRGPQGKILLKNGIP